MQKIISKFNYRRLRDKKNLMKSAVIVFPGSNCDRDIAVALKKLQFKNQMVWHK